MKLNESAACGWGVAAVADTLLALQAANSPDDHTWVALVLSLGALACAYRAGRDRSRIVLELDASLKRADVAGRLRDD